MINVAVEPSIPRPTSHHAPDRFSRWAWIAALLSILPMVTILLFHLSYAPAATRPTGFLQYDQPYYMANAREPFDAGAFSVYGLPFSPDYDTPTIYFQPAFVLLGGVAYATGLDPGLVYVAFGLVWGVLMFRIGLALYVVYAGPARSTGDKLAAISVLWGGGVAVLTGLAAELFGPSGLPLALDCSALIRSRATGCRTSGGMCSIRPKRSITRSSSVACC